MTEYKESYFKLLGMRPNFSEFSSVGALSKLQKRHMETFVHTNVDAIFSRKISLKPNMILKKFISSIRGGLCYELNCAFCELLKKLGYNAKILSARAFAYEDRAFNFNQDAHAVIVVSFDKDHYLVDVGWGSGSREPIPLECGIFEDGYGKYKLSICNDRYHLHKFVNDKFICQYSFGFVESTEKDLLAGLNYVCHSDDHHFSRLLFCNLPTETGYIALVNNLFILKGIFSHRKIIVDNISELKRILIKHFGFTEEFMQKIDDSILNNHITYSETDK